MHRIDTPGSIAGQFQDGNPAVGQQATQLLAAWFNDLQENIVHVIEQAGFDLSKGNGAQLYESIIALIAGVVGAGGGAVPTTRLVSSGGLVTGGGNLSTDRTLTVTAATSAEAAALTLDNVALTPLSLAGLMGITQSGGNTVIRIGPAIMQVFPAYAPADANTVVTLPEAFPNECFFAVSVGGIMRTSGTDNNGPFVSGRGLTSISLWNSFNDAVSVRVLAIGF